MTSVEHPRGHSLLPPARLSAILVGVLIAIAAANVWPLLLSNLGSLLGAIIEIVFLALFIWWAQGGGPPRALHTARTNAFRRMALSSREMLWGVLAALSFAVTVHASIVLLFRFIPYPAAAFRQGYNLSFIPAQQLRWLAVVISAASAAICEETGFRGFLQQPLEARYRVPAAVLTSSILFMALHLTKSWALLGMVPIVFGAGVLLGLIAWSAQSLIPGIMGHFVMDVGLFAYWWTGIAGDFRQRPISETGMDQPFAITIFIFVISLLIVLITIPKLSQNKAVSEQRQ
jgi:membrane protease YdiL (CAAX protease family)